MSTSNNVLAFPTPGNNNNNNNYAHTRARVSGLPSAIETVFEDVFDIPMRKYHRDQCSFWISEGLDPDIIVAAIQETAGAPFPAWRYTEAIIASCFANNVLSLAKWFDAQERFMEKRRRYRESNQHDR